jgi:hypothetical protein
MKRLNKQICVVLLVVTVVYAFVLAASIYSCYSYALHIVDLYKAYPNTVSEQLCVTAGFAIAGCWFYFLYRTRARGVWVLRGEEHWRRLE